MTALLNKTLLAVQYPGGSAVRLTPFWQQSIQSSKISTIKIFIVFKKIRMFKNRGT
jgi:hypothetical protein